MGRFLKAWTLLRVVVGCMLPTSVCAQESMGHQPDIVLVSTPTAVDNIYVVEEGDTLWDISYSFYDDPHFWPTLWALNPQITNPHWIYPGDSIALFPKEERARKTDFVWAYSRYAPKPKEIVVSARSMGFIPEEQFKESGKVRYSREERENLGQYDEVYIEYYKEKKIRKGDQFTIYRLEEKVYHPKTNDLVGYKVKHLGIARVLGAEKSFAKGVLSASYEEIVRGDLVTDIFEHRFLVSPRPNSADVDAVILDSFEERDFLGEHHYVFLDKGTAHGVATGNRFVVLGRGDGVVSVPKSDMDELPDEVMGEIMVVEPYENSSLGIITYSVSELVVGQRCEMRRGYGLDSSMTSVGQTGNSLRYPLTPLPEGGSSTDDLVDRHSGVSSQGVDQGVQASNR